MPRSYTLGKRAEQQAVTRRRIVESAVALHTAHGPAKTTFGMIAEHAGVQRQTIYAHFRDERALQMACSGLALERDPLPRAEGWRSMRDPAERLMHGLSELYAWFERNAQLTGCVLRDAEHHDITRETAELRFGPPLAACREALAEGLNAGQRALLGVALDFYSWRALAGDPRLSALQAAALMSTAVMSADAPLRSPTTAGQGVEKESSGEKVP
jgi:AcrR family transcriptional regulator